MTGATLSESYDPEELIPGSPSRLRAVGDSYLAAWQVSGGAIRALNTLRVAGWSGTAADAFSGSVAASAEVLTGTVPTLMDAYSALEDYRATLLSARSEASDLADRYRRSVNRSEAERDEHDAAARRAWDNGDPFGAVGEAMSEFVDLGIADRIGMEMELIGIQRRVESAGDQAAETVRTCASAAPIPTPPPNFFQTIGDGFVQWTMGSYTAFSDAVVGTGELLWDISPVRAVSDLITYGPEGFIAQRLDAYGQVLDTAGAIVADPGAALTSFVGDFFAVDMWFTNPMRALGTVQANIGMLILPGGALTKLGTAGKIAGHVRVPVIRGLGDSPFRFPERLPEGDLKLPGKAPEVGELPGPQERLPGSVEDGPNAPKLVPPGDLHAPEAAAPPPSVAPGARPPGRTGGARATLPPRPAPHGTLPPRILTPDEFPTVKVLETPGARTPFVRRRAVLEPYTHYEVPGRGHFFTDARGKVFRVDTRFRTRAEQLNSDLMHPLPNAVYNVNDRFIYDTDDMSRTVRAQHLMTYGNEPGVRSRYWTRRVGNEAGPGYHGGHLAADSFGGGSELINLVAMEKFLNLNYRSMPGQGKPSFGNLERKLNALAKGPPPKQIEVDITIDYVGDSRIPDRFKVKYLVEGESKWKSRTFTNRI